MFHPGTACAEKATDIVEHAFDLLKEDIVLAHAKDIRAGEGIAFTSAGRGIVPFRRFFELLDSIGYAGPVVAHGIHDEAEFPFSTAFLNGLMTVSYTHLSDQEAWSLSQTVLYLSPNFSNLNNSTVWGDICRTEAPTN